MSFFWYFFGSVKHATMVTRRNQADVIIYQIDFFFFTQTENHAIYFVKFSFSLLMKSLYTITHSEFQYTRSPTLVSFVFSFNKRMKEL